MQMFKSAKLTKLFGTPQRCRWNLEMIHRLNWNVLSIERPDFECARNLKKDTYIFCCVKYTFKPIGSNISILFSIYLCSFALLVDICILSNLKILNFECELPLFIKIKTETTLRIFQFFVLFFLIFSQKEKMCFRNSKLTCVWWFYLEQLVVQIFHSFAF